MVKLTRGTMLPKYWASILLIYFIPFAILGGLLYYNAVVQLRKQIETATLDRLTSAKSEFERTMNRLESLAVHMSADPELSPYHAQLNAYTSAGTVRVLGNYKAYNPLISDILLYYRGNTTMYSTIGTNSLDTLTEKIYSFPSSIGSDFEAYLNRLDGPAILPVNTVVRREDVPSQLLAMMQPIPANSLLYYGAVVFVLDQAKMTEMIDQAWGDFSGVLAIVDENDTVIATKSTLAGEVRNQFIDQLAAYRSRGGGIYESTIHRESYSISVVRSDKLGWTIVAAMPSRQFFSRVIDMRSFVLVLSSLLLLAGAGISLLMSRRIVQPLRRLSERMEHQSGYMREQALYQLIRGNVSGKKDRESLLTYQPFRREHDRFFVAFVSLGFAPERPVPTSQLDLLTDFFADLKLSALEAYGFELVERLTYAVVAGIDDDEAPVESAQQELAAFIRGRLGEEFQAKAFVGLGNAYPQLEAINRSFIEASAAAEYRVVTGNDGVVRFADVAKAEQSDDMWLPAAEQLRFVQSLKQGDYELARQTLGSMIDSIRAREQSFLILRLGCLDLVNSTAKLMREMQVGWDAGLIKQAAGFKHLDELEDILAKMAESICRHVAGMQEQRHSRLGGEMLSYIREHFRSPGLCLDELAEHFQLSPSYISRFLKEHSGVLFSECLFQLRHEEAKRLLAETAMTVKQIVQSVGYTGESKFIERFKKLEGVTPGQYRKQSEHSAQIRIM
jgi:AraC-like DNA-binding protein/ABC-type thiamin/hydroxymethylpyrimidine transport system permease subunit